MAKSIPPKHPQTPKPEPTKPQTTKPNTTDRPNSNDGSIIKRGNNSGTTKRDG